VQFADAKIYAAFRQAHLRDALIKVQKESARHTAGDGLKRCQPCSSARESLSTQSWSPMVIGRFLAALAPVALPTGRRRETEPSTKLMRATRVVDLSLHPRAPAATTNSTDRTRQQQQQA